MPALFEVMPHRPHELMGPSKLAFAIGLLAIDLGGIHAAMPGTVTLDTFATEHGLTVGQVYSLDLFQAERHPSGSNFKITTSMTFVDCGVSPPPK